jgi:MFS family permease
MNILVSTRRLAANKALGALVLANGISAIGDWLYLTAIPVLVFRQTGDPALVGAAMAARLLPWFLLSIPAGVVADRVPRAALLLVAEASRATLMVLMTALLLLDAPLWIVFGLALAAVAAGTFAMPAQGSLIPDLARNDEELGFANVVSSTFDNLACVVGPAVAGLLIVLGGLEVAFAINGASFLVVVAVLIALVRLAPAPTKVVPIEPGLDLAGARRADSWSRIASDAIRPLTMDAAISFAAGATFLLPVLVAAGIRDGGDALIGALSTSAGLGGLVGAIAAGAFVNSRPRQGLAVGIVAAVGSLGVLAASTAPIIVAGSIASVSAAITQLDTLNMTILQQSTDSRRLGRTLGLLHTLASAWVMAGSIVAGIVAGALGAGPAILVCAAVVGIIGAVALNDRPARPTESSSVLVSPSTASS